ncbi:hypothetical protein, partial [Bacillus paralicheniformis]
GSGRTARGKRKALTVVRNQGAQAAGMSQAAAVAKKNGQRSARDPEERRAANAKRSPWSGTKCAS